MSELHPTVAAAKTKLATSKTKVGSVILGMVKIALPLLGPALAELLSSPGAQKYREAAREARDVLNAANLDDE
jgi:hypothetical protein